MSVFLSVIQEKECHTWYAPTFRPPDVRKAGSSADESLCCDLTEDRPSGLHINNPFLNFTFPRTLLLTGLLIISTGHSFNPCSVILFQWFHTFLFISFTATTIFLLQVSVGFYRGLLGQKLHAAFMARSHDEVTPVTSWKTGLCSGGITSCINQMSLFSMVWTKFNCNPHGVCQMSRLSFFWYEEVESYFGTNGCTAEMLHLMQIRFLRSYLLKVLLDQADSPKGFFF